MDSGPYVNDFDDNRITDLVSHHLRRSGLATCSAIPSHRLVASKAAFHGGTATLDPVCNVDNTTERFDGVMVQIREFLINARQWSVANQTPSKRRAASLSEVFAIPSNARVYRASGQGSCAHRRCKRARRIACLPTFGKRSSRLPPPPRF